MYTEGLETVDECVSLALVARELQQPGSQPNLGVGNEGPCADALQGGGVAACEGRVPVGAVGKKIDRTEMREVASSTDGQSTVHSQTGGANKGWGDG